MRTTAHQGAPVIDSWTCCTALLSKMLRSNIFDVKRNFFVRSGLSAKGGDDQVDSPFDRGKIRDWLVEAESNLHADLNAHRPAIFHSGLENPLLDGFNRFCV
jgi:hypothetical protein